MAADGTYSTPPQGTTPQSGNWVPSNKNIAGNGTAAIAGFIIMTVHMIWPIVQFAPGYEALLAAVLSFVVSYIVPNRQPPSP